MDPIDLALPASSSEELPQQLTPEEEKEMREGMAVYEMTQSEGFRVLKTRLEDLAFHSWADPRETDGQDQWIWRELNAFHAASAAKELLDWLSGLISNYQYLEKVKSGEIKKKTFKF